MGSRANMIIVEGGSYGIYYDHWAAQTMDRKVFWGPEHVFKWIISHPKEQPEPWLDQAWCEGGILLDLDRRLLLFFGGENLPYDFTLKETFLKLLPYNWSGWETHWAKRGIVDLAEYVGHDLNDVISKVEQKKLSYEKAQKFISEPISIHYAKVLISIADNNGCGAALCMDTHGWGHYLSLGEELLALIKDVTSRQTIEIGYDEGVQEGFHIDAVNKRLLVWDMSSYGVWNPDAIKQQWPGWEVVDLLDDFLHHLRLLGSRVSLESVDENSVLETLKGIVCAEEREASAYTSSLEALVSHGYKVEANPRIFQTTPMAFGEISREKQFEEIREQYLRSPNRLNWKTLVSDNR